MSADQALDPDPDLDPEGGCSSLSGTQKVVNVVAHGPHSQAALKIVNQHQYITKVKNVEHTDVCKCLKAMLQAKHRQIKIPKMPWIDYNWEFPLEHYYVDLTVTPKEDSTIRLHAREIQLQQIFSPVANKSPTRILIEGPAGYGKSMLALKLCYDYSKGEEYIKHHELVILLRLREFKDSTIDEMLARMVTLQDYSSETIIKTIKKHQDSTLIILDGYDESDQHTREELKPLLKSEYLPAATVIVTSRPGVVDTMDDFDKRIEIKGIKGDNRSQFLQLHLRCCSEEKKAFLRDFLHKNFSITFGNESPITRLVKGFKTLFVHDKDNLFDCPLFLLLVVAVAKNYYPNIPIFSTKTELYKRIFNFIAQRTLSERLHSEEAVDLFLLDSDSPSNYARSLSQFGKLALNALRDKRFSFSKEEILSYCDDDVILHMGLVTENDYIDDIAGEQASWFQPIHLTILEFCASYYLWYTFIRQSSSFTFPIQFLPDLSGTLESFVFPFFVGLCSDKLPLFFPTLCTEQPNNFVRHLARCEALRTESTLDFASLSKALSTLVPKVWHTHYFRDGSYTPTELLKVTVAEAGWGLIIECIVHDADLNWDICMGKRSICVPLVAMKTTAGTRFLQHVHAYEMRTFARTFKNKERLLEFTETVNASVISLVKSPNDREDLPFLSLVGLGTSHEVFLLSVFLSDVLLVEITNGVGYDAVGKHIGSHTPLYKTEIVKELLNEQLCKKNPNLVWYTPKAMAFVKVNARQNMNVYRYKKCDVR